MAKDIPQRTVFDFEHDLEPPEWLVDGTIERGTVTVLAGDSGGGKSWLAESLAVEVVRGGQWLGRDVERGRVMFLDGEMGRRTVRDRLRALGMTNDLRDGLDYFSHPAGVVLGESATNEWLGDHVAKHEIAALIIDSASVFAAGDVNSNSDVAALFRTALRPCAQMGAAVVLLHHERKASEYGRNASQAVMGARQWVGQGDLVISVTASGSLSNDELPDGRSAQRYPLSLEWSKLRDGVPGAATDLVIVSERGTDDRLDWARVEARGATVEASDVLVDAIVAHVNANANGQSQRKDIAQAVGRDSRDGSFDRALTRAVEADRIKRAGHGRFEPT